MKSIDRYNEYKEMDVLNVFKDIRFGKIKCGQLMHKLKLKDDGGKEYGKREKSRRNY